MQIISNSIAHHHLAPKLSTGERGLIDIVQDRRYWVIHLITIPSVFLAGATLIITGLVYKLFGVASLNKYLITSQISLIKERFWILNEIEDI